MVEKSVVGQPVASAGAGVLASASVPSACVCLRTSTKALEYDQSMTPSALAPSGTVARALTPEKPASARPAPPLEVARPRSTTASAARVAVPTQAQVPSAPLAEA